MSLDVRTIVVVLLVSALLMSVTLALDLGKGKAPGLARWNAGLGLFAAGWLLIALRARLPAFIGVALADALMLAGLCSQWLALLEFGGRPARRWVAWAAPAAAFVTLLPLLPHYAALMGRAADIWLRPGEPGSVHRQRAARHRLHHAARGDGVVFVRLPGYAAAPQRSRGTPPRDV